MNWEEEQERTKRRRQRDNALQLRKKALFADKFSELLKVWKIKENKKGKEFCLLVGVSKNVVTGWKNGKAIPQEANLEKICKLFGVREDFFEEQCFDEYDYRYNVRAEEISQRLQKYAKMNGMDEGFYNRLIKIDGFVRLFPFHETGFNEALDTGKDDHSDGVFPALKFEFRDGNGLRKFMTEQDIDFIIQIQKQLGEQVLQSFRSEKEKIKDRKNKDLIEWNLKHYDLDREEVMNCLYSADFTTDEQEVNEDKIKKVFNSLAAKHGIKPHIKLSEICDQLGKTESEKRLKRSGYTDEEIKNMSWHLEDNSDLIVAIAESYIRRGFVIDKE